MTSGSIDTGIRGRSTFIDALRRDLPQTLLNLDGSIVLADLVEAAIEAGVALLSRDPGISDRPGSLMTARTARALSVAVLWDIEARQVGGVAVPIQRGHHRRVHAHTGMPPTGGLDDATTLAVKEYLESSRPDPGFELELGTSIASRLVEPAFLARLSSWDARPWGTPWARRPRVIAAADALTEIGLSVGGSLGPGYGVALRREGPSEFNGFLGDMVGPHEAELEPGSFDDLARALTFLLSAFPARHDAPRLSREQVEAASHQLLKEQVSSVLDSLTGRERRVLQLRFGLEDGRARTLEEVGKEVNVTSERIRQIEAKALRKLRSPAHVTDVPTTHVWAMRGRKRTTAIGRLTPGRIPRLIHEVVSTLPWRPVGAGQVETASDLPMLPGVGEPCPTCGETDGGVLAAKRGRFGPFVGCNRYPDCAYIKKDGPPPPDQLPFEVACPRCMDGTLKARRARSTGSVFWGCSRYPKCDFTTSFEPVGAFHDADDGPVARAAVAIGICLACGAAVPLPDEGGLVGRRLPSGPADPAALTPAKGDRSRTARSRTSHTRRSGVDRRPAKTQGGGPVLDSDQDG